MRQEFIIYVVPMLNIDGVMQGNQRTNLSGWDLNRRWAEPSPYLCPAIWAAKNLARIVQAEREIVTYCDMHGHFQSYGSFIYGNSYDKGSGVEPPDFAESAMLRIIPQYLAWENKHFEFNKCTYTLEAYKMGSAR